MIAVGRIGYGEAIEDRCACMIFFFRRSIFAFAYTTHDRMRLQIYNQTNMENGKCIEHRQTTLVYGKPRRIAVYWGEIQSVRNHLHPASSTSVNGFPFNDRIFNI